MGTQYNPEPKTAHQGKQNDKAVRADTRETVPYTEYIFHFPDGTLSDAEATFARRIKGNV